LSPRDPVNRQPPPPAHRFIFSKIPDFAILSAALVVFHKKKKLWREFDAPRQGHRRRRANIAVFAANEKCPRFKEK